MFVDNGFSPQSEQAAPGDLGSEGPEATAVLDELRADREIEQRKRGRTKEAFSYQGMLTNRPRCIEFLHEQVSTTACSFDSASCISVTTAFTV